MASRPARAASGQGHAAERIADALRGIPVDEWHPALDKTHALI